MLPFFKQPAIPQLPDGYRLESGQPPTPGAINKLLAACQEFTPDEAKWPLVLERSLWHLSVFEESSGDLVGFVRATSDQALNANLWNLAARPGPDQTQLFTVLVHRALHILRRDLPGCSLSISAPAMSLDALKSQGFMIDPSGIRAMGLRLKPTSEID